MAQNGGIIGPVNVITGSACAASEVITTVTSSTPSAVTLQPSTQKINTVVVAGGGAAGMDNSGGGGAGGVLQTNCISVTGGSSLGAVVIGAGAARNPAPGSGPSGPAPGTGPSGPGPSDSPPEAEEKEDTSWMVERRVDDDGTEWAQNEDETWYFREPGQTDWSVWED